MFSALIEAKKRHHDQVMAILMPKGMAWELFTKMGFNPVCEFPFYIYGVSAEEIAEKEYEWKSLLDWQTYTQTTSKVGFCQGVALNLSQAKPASKQLNLNKLSDADGLKFSG